MNPIAIPMSCPEISREDVRAVAEVVRSGRLAWGPKSEEFERLVAEYCQVRHGVAVSSGTAGLHLSLLALGLEPGDEVLVPSFTFAATVNVIALVGATPVFVDIEPDTLNVSPEDLQRKVTERTRAIMAVDVFGHPADWRAILDIARRARVGVIDDCCEAIGATYDGRRLGGFGTSSVFGFYPNKQMTTGEGGMIVTDDDEVADFCRSMRNQGRGKSGSGFDHIRAGVNYRLDEMSAALGVSQFRRLESFLAKRELLAALYDQKVSTIAGLRPLVSRPEVRKSWFVYVVILDRGRDRDSIMMKMAHRGVATRAYFDPVHLHPYLQAGPGSIRGRLPVTEDLARRTLALPFHNNLSERQVDIVVDALSQAIRHVNVE
jgi:perosamine synthetase